MMDDLFGWADSRPSADVIRFPIAPQLDSIWRRHVEQTARLLLSKRTPGASTKAWDAKTDEITDAMRALGANDDEAMSALWRFRAAVKLELQRLRGDERRA